MLGTFFPPENIGNFRNRPEPDIFLWWKAKQFNQKNRKEKKYYGYVIFFIHHTFFLFCHNVFSFFILTSVYRPSIRDSILQGIHTLPVHQSDFFFLFLL
jgi:hypothetical protein